MNTQANTQMSPQTMIRNIWAIGRNYSGHAVELGNPVPAVDSDPMVFLKAGTSAVENGATFPLPSFATGLNINFETEVALRFGPDLSFTEITLALDLTARELQSQLKAKGDPWTLAKSLKSSCPLGPLVAIPKEMDLQNLEFQLKVNGELRQKGNTRDMIHPIEKMRRYVIDRFPVAPGDLLLTGTPPGVAALRPGDALEAEIPGLLTASWRVAPQA